MSKPRHNHSALIADLEKVLRSQFSLSPQRFFQWKKRGVPYAFRAEVARLAGIHSVALPEGFLNAPATLERAA